MDKSTHKAEVVRIAKLEPHPNADSLSIVKPFGSGYEVVVKTSDWKPGDLAVYIVPDSMVPLDEPEFAWLKERPEGKYNLSGRVYHRVRVARLRKVYSQGLLIKAPEGVNVGDDCAPLYGMWHYEPPVKTGSSKKMPAGSQAEPKPLCNPPVYDIDSIRRYAEVMRDGEPVAVTEKIHGANCRFTAEDRGAFSFSFRDRGLSVRFGSWALTWRPVQGFRRVKMPEYMRWMRVGSRTQWRRPDPGDTWWRALESCPQIAAFCKAHPGKTLYGEVYGDVQDLDYGVPAGQVRFVAFDILGEDGFLDDQAFRVLCDRYGIPTVPYMFTSLPYSLETVLLLAEGRSILAASNGKTHVREGVVVKPLSERYDHRIGRVILKAVGNGYLERA